MRRIYSHIIRIVVFTPMFFLLIAGSCDPPNTTGDTGTGGTSDQNNYIITQTGNINDPNDFTTEKLDLDYNTFLLLTDGVPRNIYFGGLLPSSTYANEVNIICDALGVDDITNQTINYQITNNGPYYYYVPFSIYSTFFATPGEYLITANLQYNGTATGDQLVCTLKVAENIARSWTLDVYEQIAYYSINFTEEKIRTAFNELQVSLGVDVKNSSMIDETINWDRTHTSYDENELVIYAYLKVYPNKSTPSAIADYAIEHPNNGLLFYIKNYNIIDNEPLENLNGVTFAYGGTVARLPALCFVFVERVRIGWHNDWEENVLSATSIHEAGHLWCEGFTDNDTHQLWHNGDYLKSCVMINPYVKDAGVNGVPDAQTQNILENLKFCEGHVQRGLNVSWYLKQYAPYGETTNGSNQYLYALNGSPAQYNNIRVGDDLKINIESYQKDYIQGKLIDVLVRVKNNTQYAIKLHPADHLLFSYEESKTIDSQPMGGYYATVVIPPYQEYIYLVNPLKYVNHKKEDKGLLPGLPWYYWPEGDYDYYISYKFNNKVYTSNKIPITILPVPDSLTTAFEDLKADKNNPDLLNFSTYKFESLENLFEKYRETFYEKEFLYKLINNWNYTYAIANKKEAESIRPRAMELYKEFILKYPNTQAAFSYLRKIYIYRDKGNENLLTEIISSLESNEEATTLLQLYQIEKNKYEERKKGFKKEGQIK